MIKIRTYRDAKSLTPRLADVLFVNESKETERVVLGQLGKDKRGGWYLVDTGRSLANHCRACPGLHRYVDYEDTASLCEWRNIARDAVYHAAANVLLGPVDAE